MITKIMLMRLMLKSFLEMLRDLMLLIIMMVKLMVRDFMVSRKIMKDSVLAAIIHASTS